MENEQIIDINDTIDSEASSEAVTSDTILTENVHDGVDENLLKSVSGIIEKQIAEAFQKRLNSNIPKKSKRPETDAFVTGLFRK